MNDNQETMMPSKWTNMPEKVEDINRRCQPLIDHYKRITPEDTFSYLDFAFYCMRMMWRYIPEKLLYPAIEKWEKAINDGNDPLDIFLLGWETGKVIEDLDTRMMASIHGRLHRTGIRTAKREVNSKFRKIYEEYQSAGNTKTLNKLLQDEFGIKSINKPNKELSRLRSQYYRAKSLLEQERYHEDISDHDVEFENQYLNFLIRQVAISDYKPNIGYTLIDIKTVKKTLFDRFIHEAAHTASTIEGFKKLMERIQKEEARACKTPKRKKDDETRQ